ncbi:uncharacterized protein LOC113155252 [Anabas testudineus]|uniref:uncharacterized protein LOC113155252 n=1 Tax=Anabas testudineus TaxID=64144 RepID=UPI000E4605C6|nr:uncharacterized protein LOC113155252 [Anabas testudineus]
MKMKMKIYSCLLVLVLGCNVTAEIIHEVKEKQHVTLRCPHSVEGKVTWSREINGNKVDIFTIDGDRETRYNDPGRRYSSQTDKSLTINRAVLSDSGKYFCNNEPAVELKVNQEIIHEVVEENQSVTLRCPHSVEGRVFWSKDGDKGAIMTVDDDKEIKYIHDPDRRYSSSADKSLNINRAVLSDSGRYSCNNKSAVELEVIRPGIKTPPPPPTTTTTQHHHHQLVLLLHQLH